MSNESKGAAGALNPLPSTTLSAEERRRLLAHLLERKNSGSRIAPLSHAQQRLWFLDQLAPGSPFYNMPVALRLTIPLDISALTRSLDEIVRRHEALRTTFAVQNGQQVQMIAPLLHLDMPVVDLQHFSDPETEARQQANEEARNPFDLAIGPLIRARLLRLAPQDHVLLLTLHHIIADGWSLGILFRELTALYVAFTKGDPSSLPDLPIQYADMPCGSASGWKAMFCRNSSHTGNANWQIFRSCICRLIFPGLRSPRFVALAVSLSCRKTSFNRWQRSAVPRAQQCS